MSTATREVSGRLLRRCCLWCGYHGCELQEESLESLVCPQCGADLYARPPRSYAEMEGLDATPLPRRTGRLAGLPRRLGAALRSLTKRVLTRS